MSTKIKFCGITRLEDAEYAVALGVDALGFVFHPPSPRYLAPAAAADLARRLPPFLCKVGLFVNAGSAAVADVVAAVGLDVVQFHGDEAQAECERSPRPWIKAIRVRDAADVAAAARDYPAAGALLYDSYDAAVYGGSGRTFDWRLLDVRGARPAILAGGLAPGNVAEAIRCVRPYAVDVSGGIELSKGRKDRAKMADFVREVRRVEREA